MLFRPLQTTAKKPNTTADKVTANGRLKQALLGKLLLSAVALLLAVSMVFAMTAAWYTNVVQSGGLIFNVTEWDMQSNVTLEDVFTSAAPGEGGALAVEVRNENEGLIDVRLSISKVPLYNDVVDMRKRLYFYIDDTVVRDGETVNRVYLNSAESYNYTVMAKQTLQLGDGGNDASLKWEWVYDVLGYYFSGSVTADAVTVDEYLRPVEYDLDAATFENGKLKTVDGTTGLADFITQLTKNDGFAGTASTPVTVGDKAYYPVSVDENGHGIWIYCLDFNEIEHETAVDTALAGTAEQEKRQFKTILNVVTEQKKLSVATVGSVAELQAALSDDTHNMIVLAGDMEIGEPIILQSGKEKMLDLGEHTVSIPLNDHAFKVNEGGSLTVMNGTVNGVSTTSGSLVHVVGGNVALSGLTVTDMVDVVWVADQTSKNGDSRVTITDCYFHCADSGVFVKGNGVLTEAPSRVVIENSTIISDGYYAIVGNGSALPAGGNYGTDITVRGSTIKAPYTAIYHPQRESRLLVENSVLEGMTPLTVKGGDVVLNDATLQATNDDGTQEKIEQPAANKNGFNNTGAGVYIEGGYETLCSVQINGNTRITAHYAAALLLFDPDGTGHTITVTGGNFSHDVSAFVADGYTCTTDGNGRYTVQKEQTS